MKLIDSTLKRPFFLRDKEGKVKTEAEETSVYAEENRTFQIEAKILKEIYKKNYNQNSKENYENIKLIDYKYFERKFWSIEKIKHKEHCNKLNSLTIWTEIMSHIKGAAISYSYENWHIPKEEYRDYIGIAKTFVSKEMKDLIWEIAQNYEKWKSHEKMFDLMDLVSYLLNEILHVIFYQFKLLNFLSLLLLL